MKETNERPTFLPVLLLVAGLLLIAGVLVVVFVPVWDCYYCEAGREVSEDTARIRIPVLTCQSCDGRGAFTQLEVWQGKAE